MKANVYSTEGKKVSDLTLPENVFGVKWNPDLVHEVVVSMQSNARAGTADTKDRSEVRGGGKKPWKQKGTGRARHGSRRSPIWTGGGVAHGPLAEKDYSKKINKKVRAKALATVLSKKQDDQEVIFVDSFGFDAPKATKAKEVLAALGGIKGAEDLATKQNNAALILLPSRDENVERSFRNFGNVVVSQTKDINPVDLLTFKYVIVAEPDAALEILEARIGTRTKATN